MPGITADQLKQQRQNFMEQAGQAFDGMLGSDGQNGLVTFAEREERACELGDALTCRLLEEHLGAEESRTPGLVADCPMCGRPVACDATEKIEQETRRVKTRRGEIDFQRAARNCKHCRRIFFPR